MLRTINKSICIHNITNKFKKTRVLSKGSYASCKTNNKHHSTSYQHHQRDVQDHVVDILYPNRTSRLPFIYERVKAYANQQSSKQLRKQKLSLFIIISLANHCWFYLHIVITFNRCFIRFVIC